MSLSRNSLKTNFLTVHLTIFLLFFYFSQSKIFFEFADSILPFFKATAQGIVDPTVTSLDLSKLTFSFKSNIQASNSIFCRLSLNFRPGKSNILVQRSNQENKSKDIEMGDKIWYLTSNKIYSWDLFNLNQEHSQDCKVLSQFDNLTLEDFREKSFTLDSVTSHLKNGNGSYLNFAGKIQINVLNFDVKGFTLRQLRQEMMVQSLEYKEELGMLKQDLLSKLDSTSVLHVLNKYKREIEMHFFSFIRDAKTFCETQQKKIEKSKKIFFCEISKNYLTEERGFFSSFWKFLASFFYTPTSTDVEHKIPFCASSKLDSINSMLTNYISKLQFASLGNSLFQLYKDSVRVNYNHIEEMFDKNQTLLWFRAFRNFFLTAQPNSQIKSFKTLIKEYIQLVNERTQVKSPIELINVHLHSEQNRLRQFVESVNKQLFSMHNESHFKKLDEEDRKEIEDLRQKMIMKSFFAILKQDLMEKVFIDSTEVLDNFVRNICRFAVNSRLIKSLGIVNADASVNVNLLFHLMALTNTVEGQSRDYLEYQVFKVTDLSQTIQMI